ncbi:hypothetical protein [Phormidesmis priestleyi]
MTVLLLGIILGSAIALLILVRFVTWNDAAPLNLNLPDLPRSTLSSTRKRRKHLLKRRNSSHN